MHHADRIVMPMFRHALENRAAFFDRNELKAERLRDRRRRQASVNDALQKVEPALR